MKTINMDTLSEKKCPICGSKQINVFFEISDTPVHCCLLWTSKDTAKNCPKGDIKLAFCSVCGFIWNLTFDPDLLKYSQRYENSLFFSPYFQDYSRWQAERLIKRYNLYNKKIIEIGCGRGNFLLLLSKLGKNFGLGFNPTYSEEEKLSKAGDKVKFVHDFYTEKYWDYQADLIICRHVLEHVDNPKDFLKRLRQAIGGRLNTYLFFEIPNALRTFRELSMCEIIYEHYSYFTPFSLSFIFASSEFRICKLTEQYEGQFLCIDARPYEQPKKYFDYHKPDKIKQLDRVISSFATNYRKKVKKRLDKLMEINNNSNRIVIWGAGSRGVTFLNTYKIMKIDYAVDINPHKQGMYIPGTGQKIVPPEFLRGYRPDVIIIMNPIYKKEIRDFTKSLGIETNFLSM